MAQSGGKIVAQLYDAKTKEALPFGAVNIYSGESLIASGKSNIEGEFRPPNLTPGSYDVHINYAGYQKRIMKNVEVSSGNTTDFKVPFTEADVTKSFFATLISKGPIYSWRCIRIDEYDFLGLRNYGIYSN
jgi:hypothetical protein